jgi:YidC/Oxa1 family membrane protein insertase
MYQLYHEAVFQPLYNGLVAIMDLLPWADVGIAVIIFTVIVRLILFPFYKHSLLAQVRMKAVEPEINKIKAKYADDKQAQGLKVMEFYKENDIHPFRSLLLPLIQLPILLAFVSVFYQIIPAVHPEFLYSFVHIPIVKPTLLGLDLTHKNIFLSLLTGVIQFLQLRFSVMARQQRAMSAKMASSGAGKPDAASQMMNSMNTNMQLFIPVLAFASTYWLIPLRFPQAASIVAIYWSVSTLFTLGQELYIRKVHLNDTVDKK